jgi:hypothetical protein
VIFDGVLDLEEHLPEVSLDELQRWIREIPASLQES